MPPHYKLMYFGFRMRGEPIRYLLALSNTPYENAIVAGQDWPAMKPKMPMKTLPVLELPNGMQLSQSMAIARFVALKTGLTSSCPFENAWGDQLVGAVEDIYPIYYSDYANAMMGNDEGKKAATLKALKEKGFEPLFTTLERFLGDKKWFCGEKVHWSDVIIAELVNRVDTCFDKKLVAKFSKLMAHCKRIHECPNLSKYVASRPPAGY